MSAAAVSQLVESPFDEGQVRATAQELRGQLGQTATVGFAFATPDYADHWEDFSETLRIHAHIPLLLGVTASGIIGNGVELEEGSGFSVTLLRLPETEVKTITISPEQVSEEEDGSYWTMETAWPETVPDLWISCLDASRFPIEMWLEEWNKSYPRIPMVGGLVGPNQQVFVNERSEGDGVLLGLRGAFRATTVVSQGCKPIGNPYTITDVEHNLLHTLGSLPAYHALNEAFEGLTIEEKERARGNLLAGLAMSEYVEEFHRGDFLVRAILGADPASGSVALGALPRLGQTLQYQLRDARAASEELVALLKQAAQQTEQRPPLAALMFSCLGRGRGLFGTEHHDAGMVDRFFPDIAMGGFFANGEIGPVAQKNFVHSYTASMVLIG